MTEYERNGIGGQDSIPVRGVPYEPSGLRGASGEPRLSQLVGRRRLGREET
jgi:hypothetical protein